MKQKETLAQETFIPNFQSPQQFPEHDHPMTMKELQSASNKRNSQITADTKIADTVSKESEKNLFKSSVREAAELPESIRKVKEEIRKKVER